MKIKPLYIAITCLLAAIIGGTSCAVFFPIKSNALNHVILAPLENKFKRKFQFQRSSIRLAGNVFLKDVTVTDKSGMAFHASTASVKYNLIDVLFGKKETEFFMENTKFYKDVSLLNSVSSILVIAKMPNVEFDTIEGSFYSQNDAVYIKKFLAANDKINISGKGWVTKAGELDGTVHFSFGKTITDTVPSIVKATLLYNEGGGRMGITLKASGNYTKPFLNIDSSTFKMNIKEGILKLK